MFKCSLLTVSLHLSNYKSIEHIIGHNNLNNYHGHYSHAGGLSINNYVGENNVHLMSVNINYQSPEKISFIFHGGLVDNHLKMTICDEICDCESNSK